MTGLVQKTFTRFMKRFKLFRVARIGSNPNFMVDGIIGVPAEKHLKGK